MRNTFAAGYPVLMFSLVLGVIPGGRGVSPTIVQADEDEDQRYQAPEPQQVVIEREQLLTRSPEDYQITLQLVPTKSIELVALTDGVVSAINTPAGSKVQQQAEVLRLESRLRQLELDRARAIYEATKSATEAGLAASERPEVARIDLEVAQVLLDQTTVRAPFEGTVTRLHVVPGQYVRAGDPVATLSDLTKLSAEIPVDRKSTKPGDNLELRIEGSTQSVAVDTVDAIPPRFESLRGLFESIGSAVVSLDNANAQWQVGQTVYSPLVPRQPVAEVPNSALVNSDDGTRRVQVIRDGFVRDVSVQLLGAVGEDRTYVSGRFGLDDELVVNSSELLLDGTQVIPRTELEATPATNTPGRPQTPAGVPRRPDVRQRF